MTHLLILVLICLGVSVRKMPVAVSEADILVMAPWGELREVKEVNRMEEREVRFTCMAGKKVECRRAGFR